MPSTLSLASRRVLRLCAAAVFVTTLVACSKAEAPKEPLRAVKVLTVAGGALNDLKVQRVYVANTRLNGIYVLVTLRSRG